MHSLVRRFIKTGILFLLVGLTLGAVLVVRRELLGEWPDPYWVSAHTHAILVGFVMMMILGVALWLFPRPEKGDTRYAPQRVELAYWSVATGTALRIAGEIGRSSSGATWLRWLVVVSSLAQVAGMALFFFTMWSRVRAVGSAGREAKGERF